MQGRTAALVVIALVIGVFMSCRKDVPPPPSDTTPTAPTSPVVFNMDSVPYGTLSHYHFFNGPLVDQQPVEGVIPYEPITPLFSDYAHKYRFVWMPAGRKAHYVSDSQVFDFPEGTILIKSFYYDHVQPSDRRQFLETRLMIKKNGTWTFADYIWNDAQDEAVLDMTGRYVPLTWADAGGHMHDETYRIPSEAECFTCHKYYDQTIPIGPKPQNLNSTYNYAEGPMNQLARWEAAGYLQSGYPANIETVARWDDPNESTDRRVRAYLDMNCSHCHDAGRHCDYRPLRLAWWETTDPVNMGQCVPPEDLIDATQSKIIHPGNAARSMLYFRIHSNDIAVRMPLLGRTVNDTAAVQLIGGWINAMPDTCQ